MYKLRHGNLEIVRYNPSKFWELIKPESTYFPPYTYNKGLKGAIVRFHQSSISVASAHLSDYLLQLKNEKRKEEVWKRFENYTKSYNGKICYALNNDFRIPLKGGIFLTGKCFRIDKDSKGNYYCYVTGSNSLDWVKELRFPLIQQYYSNFFKVETSKIHVGVFDISKVEHECFCFDVISIESAINEVNKLCGDIIELAP